MLKKGKKIILLVLAFALALAALAGCKGGRTSSTVDYEPTDQEATSNGGFVVEKGGWYYFINGAESSSSDNTYGEVVKGSLMRIKESDLASGKYSAAEIVIPQMMVASDYTSGIYIYGDTVYYATPNTTKNMDGDVESSYLDFKSAGLDGTAMKDRYLQVSDNTTVYRYVQDGEDVYLLYVDSSNTEIHSYNTRTGTDTVLVKGYSAYQLDSQDPTNPVVYYTMPVVKKNNITENESYQQIYRVSASATKSPYEFDFSGGYQDEDGEDMEYINLGELVLDGIGSDKTEKSPFNHDWAAGTAKSLSGFTYSFIKYMDGKLILSVTKISEGTTFVYALDESAIGEGWNSVTANPGGDDGKLSPVAVSTANATASALYYTNESNELCYIYVDSAGAIWRVTVSQSNADTDYSKESVLLARGQTSATLLKLADGYLYFSNTGTNGKALYRIRYDGAKEQYNGFEGAAAENDDYKATKYLALDFNDSWYSPELVGNYLFFSNKESYASSYVYVMENPADNAALKALNDAYEAITDAWDDIAVKFSNASNAAKYYFYVGNDDLIQDQGEAYYAEYTEEDLEILKAFIEGGSAYGMDFSAMKSGDTVINKQTDFYNLLGKMSDADKESVEEEIQNALLPAIDEESADDAGWTWQWAAIFVPVGVVVIAGAVVAVILIRKRKIR